MPAEFGMRPSAPFRLDLTAWTLRRQAHNAIDRWDGSAYRRVFTFDEQTVEATVRQIGGERAPRLHIELDHAVDDTVTKALRQSLRRTLGLSSNLAPFYAAAKGDPQLQPLAAAFVGMRPPRFPNLFEGLCNAIACQQLSLHVGIELLNRLSARYGRRAGEGFAFPRPADLLEVPPEALRAMGYSMAKARTLLGVAAVCASGELSEAELEKLDTAAAIKRLVALRGIGRWSTEYVLLRGFSRLEIFPGDDVGARKHLADWLGIEAAMDYQRVAKSLEPWRLYGGLIYFHLLLRRLKASGRLDAVATQ